MIRIAVDTANPGQFFACCGLLELADRIWPRVEGWFESANQFVICNDTSRQISLDHLCLQIMQCDFLPLLSHGDSVALAGLNERKADLKRKTKSLSIEDEKERKRLNSKRITSGFHLGSPFNISVDWWLFDSCDGNHLKTWSGQQAIASVAQAIHNSLRPASAHELLDYEALIRKNGEIIAPLNFDSGRVGTAQGMGYSPDKIGQPITCCVWTEFLTLIALQRFSLKPDAYELFTYSVWNTPFSPCAGAVAARGIFAQQGGCEGQFRLISRGGKGYTAFQQANLSEWRK